MRRAKVFILVAGLLAAGCAVFVVRELAKVRTYDLPETTDMEQMGNALRTAHTDTIENHGWSWISRLQPATGGHIKLSMMCWDRDRMGAQECDVSDENIVKFRGFYEMSLRGGSGWAIAKTNVARFDELIARLPADNPPSIPERRLVVSVHSGNTHLTRTYDRAKLPDEILEISRLARGFGSWVAELEPFAEIDAFGDRASEDSLALSPDGKTLVAASPYAPLKVWDASSRELLKTLDFGPHLDLQRLQFSPDGKLLAVNDDSNIYFLDPKTWQVKHVQPTKIWCGDLRFTPDGLFSTSSERDGLEIYNTATWQNLPAFPGLPNDIAQYAASGNGKWGVLETKDHTIELWDLAGKNARTELDKNRYCRLIRFSPDSTRVALATEPRPVPKDWPYGRIRVFDLASARLVHELWLGDVHPTSYSMRALRWTPDGKYLLGFGYDEQSIHVWDIATGRQRIELRESGAGVNGLEVTNDGKTIVATNANGKILFWDFAKGLEEVAALDNSVALQAK